MQYANRVNMSLDAPIIYGSVTSNDLIGDNRYDAPELNVAEEVLIGNVDEINNKSNHGGSVTNYEGGTRL